MQTVSGLFADNDIFPEIFDPGPPISHPENCHTMEAWERTSQSQSSKPSSMSPRTIEVIGTTLMSLGFLVLAGALLAKFDPNLLHLGKYAAQAKEAFLPTMIGSGVAIVAGGTILLQALPNNAKPQNSNNYENYQDTFDEVFSDKGKLPQG